MPAPHNPELRAEARRRYEDEHHSLHRIAADMGIHNSTLGRWASNSNDPWKRPPTLKHRIPTDTDLAEGRRRLEAAMTRNRRTWALRREDEANAIGELLSPIRDAILRAIEANKASDARNFAVTLAILADKAQLLTGGQVGRTWGNVPEVVRDDPKDDDEDERVVSVPDVREAAIARELTLLRQTEAS